MSKIERILDDGQVLIKKGKLKIWLTFEDIYNTFKFAKENKGYFKKWEKNRKQIIRENTMGICNHCGKPFATSEEKKIKIVECSFCSKKTTNGRE